jgi:hypothetical protein
MRRGLIVLGLLLAAAPARAGGSKPLPCQDPCAINWVLPGQFEAARDRAAKENRILMIKGIAFGVDAAGAKCATKGQW